MANEINNFIKVWISIFISQSYCYVIAKLVSKGFKRLIFYIPILCLFLIVPLKLSTIHLIVGTSFFITWLGSFKLLLLAFGKGPLALDPSISLVHFIIIFSLPIEIKQNPSTKDSPNNKNPIRKWSLNFPIKALLLAIIIGLMDYFTKLPKNLINNQDIILLVIHCLFIYLLLEVILAVATISARAVLGVVLEPFFDEPYLATSLQDFWGRRWNLMVTRILRPTIYNPTFKLWAGLVGPKWAQFPAIVATFLVSGLVHELLYYYVGRSGPTWEVTCFFILHGLCLTVEIMVKKALDDTWQLSRVVSGALTIGFIMLTSFWLFFPQLLRYEVDVRVLQEYASLGEFFRNIFTQRLPIF